MSGPTTDEAWDRIYREAETKGLHPHGDTVNAWASFMQSAGYVARVHGGVLNGRIVDAIAAYGSPSREDATAAVVPSTGPVCYTRGLVTFRPAGSNPEEFQTFIGGAPVLGPLTAGQLGDIGEALTGAGREFSAGGAREWSGTLYETGSLGAHARRLRRRSQEKGAE